MASPCPRSLPELVGVSGEIATAQIEKENPNVNAIVKLKVTSVTEDFNCNRVWIWVDTHRAVTNVPRVG
ncbi:Proteinase inhibitor [Parasponia andersonii]|uniref:Proteinase inhibitor n=1 Tax=Parasponia andersonii TaxID=3476 RepID=A0A2P5CGM0_PARAD|nr:Proteinase inhibitor [Parasponia andersonii]